MKSVMFRLKDVQYPEFCETYPTEDEMIQLVGFDLFQTDIIIKTSLKEINEIKEYFILKGKLNCHSEFIKLDDIIKEQISFEYHSILSFSYNVFNCKSNALNYLILSDLLFGKQLIRLI